MTFNERWHICRELMDLSLDNTNIARRVAIVKYLLSLETESQQRKTFVVS